jgi:hypothetical protein
MNTGSWRRGAEPSPDPPHRVRRGVSGSSQSYVNCHSLSPAGPAAGRVRGAQIGTWGEHRPLHLGSQSVVRLRNDRMAREGAYRRYRAISLEDWAVAREFPRHPPVTPHAVPKEHRAYHCLHLGQHPRATRKVVPRGTAPGAPWASQLLGGIRLLNCRCWGIRSWPVRGALLSISVSSKWPPAAC